MIHSLSGGVIAENGVYTFLKVEVKGQTVWYLTSERGAKAGGKVLVPFGEGDFPEEGTILKVEEATLQCAPVPAKHLKEILKLL